MNIDIMIGGMTVLAIVWENFYKPDHGHQAEKFKQNPTDKYKSKELAHSCIHIITALEGTLDSIHSNSSFYDP